MKLAPDAIVELVNLRDAVAATAHGGRLELINKFATARAISTKTAIRWLTNYGGFKSGRKKRADAGKTSASDKLLDFVATTARECMRGNGKLIMPTAVSLTLASKNGYAVPVGAAQINRLLRDRKMNVKALAATKTTGQMQSLYPNHVHLVDPSLCVLYYAHGKLNMMRDEEFNRNKLSSFAKIKTKLWRYVLVDHASARITVKYYESDGENQQNLFDFLMFAWERQESRLQYGVPRMLVWDRGSANTSASIANLLGALEIDNWAHAVGHPWAKGAVEVANNIVETHFECLLKYEPKIDTASINQAATDWANSYNANLFEHQDCRVKRDGGAFVRDELWRLIMQTPSALRECPPREVCEWFMVGRENVRQVKNLSFTFVHPEIGESKVYSLSEYAEFLSPKETVSVRPVLMKGGAVRVEIARVGQEPLVAEVLPETEYNQFGKLVSAPVWGENYQAARDTASMIHAKRLVKVAYGAETLEDAEAARRKQERPFANANDGKGLVAFAGLAEKNRTIALLPKSTPLQNAQITQAMAALATAEPIIPLTTALMRLVREWRRGISADENKLLRELHPEGVPESILTEMIKNKTIGELHDQRTEKIA